MRIQNLGKTELPMDVVQDYLDSIRPIYTLDAYDLWRHNCNNFSNDFATFLLGKGIPDYITSMPDTVMNSPFGRLLRPSIDDAIRNNHNRVGGVLGLAQDQATRVQAPLTTHQRAEAVRMPEDLQSLHAILASARKSCAIIFFTSATCPPCKAMYPIYDELASEIAHKCTFIKVDIGKIQDAGKMFLIRSTPTFVTFLHGEEEGRWSGADSSALRGNVKLLVEMAWPTHPHERLRLLKMRSAAARPIAYKKVPPLDKLLAKIGPEAKQPPVQGVKSFIAASQREGAADATLPDLNGFSIFLRHAPETVPIDNLFAVYDLARVAMADIRVAGYYAEEKDHKTISKLLKDVNKLPSGDDCPYALKLVALQMSCNLFSSPLYIPHILGCETLRAPIITLITSSLLDSKHHSVRVAAASLVLNIASANAKIRVEERREALPEDDAVELAAGLLESIGAEEESVEALRGFLLALGQLAFCAANDSELVNLLQAMDAMGTVENKSEGFPGEPLIMEVKEILKNLM